MREGRIKKKNGDDAVREVIEDQHLPTLFFFLSFFSFLPLHGGNLIWLGSLGFYIYTAHFDDEIASDVLVVFLVFFFFLNILLYISCILSFDSFLFTRRIFFFSRVQPTSLPPSDRARMRKESRREETLISFNTMMICAPPFFSPVVPDSLPSRFHPWIFVFIIYPVRLRRVFPRFVYLCFLYFLPSFIFVVFMNYSTCRSMFRPLCFIYLSNPPSCLFSEFFWFLSLVSVYPPFSWASIAKTC